MHTSIATETQFTKLIQFRQAAYRCLGKARDAQLELTDAVMLTAAARSFAELSLSPVFRRRWPSLYEAIQDGCPDRAGLLRLYAAQILPLPRVLVAGDHTAWPRLSARTLRDRTVEHQPTKVVGNRPITVGQGYGTLVWLPPTETATSWALPFLHERVSSAETPIGKAISQLRRVTMLLPTRPISLWDAEYGNATFVNGSADIAADKILRLRSNLCLWGHPPPYCGHGRPAVHGDRFKLKDASTWGEPAEVLEVEDAQLSRVQIALWLDRHFRKSPRHPMVVIRIERPDARGTRRQPKELWLVWVGEAPPPLADWWRLYLRRFAVDHTGIASPNSGCTGRSHTLGHPNRPNGGVT